MKFEKLLLAVLVFLAGAHSVSAQVSASVSGHVEDASGAAVNGASVIVRSVETGATRTVQTDERGNYRVLALPIGLHEIRAERTGFKTAVRQGINLLVGQDANIDLKLEVGDLSQQVTVTAETPLVNVSTSSVSGLVGESQVKDLPLNGRSFDSLITLNAGAINYGLKTPQTSTSYGNTFSVSGRRPGDNLFLMNGVEYTGSSQLSVTPGGVSGQLLGIDAVREFNVLTDNYSAEYGKRSGAQVTVVTQSGTNTLHGSLFEFLRNDKLDARNFFDNILPPGTTSASVPPFRRNQFGGALGGPIKKDKLFLFGNYEGFRQALATTSVASVPNAQVRAGGVPNATTGIYAPVPNLDLRMLPYFAMWPVANGPELLVASPSGALIPSGLARSFNNPRQSIREDFTTLRADYVISTNDSLSGSYTLDDGYIRNPVVDPLFGSASALRNQVATLRETHIFSPRVLNTATIGFSRAAFNLDGYSTVNFPANLSFVTGKDLGPITILGGATTAGPNGAAGVSNRRNLFTFTDTVQIVHGRHSISAGVWFQRMRDNQDAASRREGLATFASLTTFLQGTVGVNGMQVVTSPAPLGWRSLFGAWFIEDNIKLRQNLTLRVGLRHEFTDGYNEVYGRASNYVFDNNAVLLTNPRVAGSLFSENNARRLFGPRVGLAWDVFGNGKTAVRAGYGTYYSIIDSLAFLVNALPPFNGSASFSNRSLFSIIPITPAVQPAPACVIGGPAACTTFAPQGIQSDASTPTVQQWTLSIEQQLAANTALRVSYVGSHGYHGMLSVDPNTLPAQICANAAGCLAGGIGAVTNTVPNGTKYIPVAAGQAPCGTARPNPCLSSAFFWQTQGNTSYNALQVEVTRRLTRGLQFRGNYTWAKNLDMNSALTGAQSNNQAQMVMDSRDPRRDWGPSALNVKHQATISARYDLPIGPGKALLGGVHGVTGKIIGGWQLNGIATFLSGFPFTPLIGANRSGNGDTRNPDRPSVNPAFTGPVIIGSPDRWYNPNAFVRPLAGTWGNVGRGVYNGPGLRNVDVSLFKSFAFTERINLQFRAEAFNVFNHTNFAQPNSTTFNGAVASGTAGLISTTVTTSRQMQLGLKLVF